MEAERRSVREIFLPVAEYVIPIFQRHYVWDKADQWEPLWEDIISQLRARLERRTATPHYCGAIVIEERNRESLNDPTRFNVIDGQQRLTTFQIILSSIRDSCLKQEAFELSQKVGKLIFNPNDDGAKNTLTELIKIRPTKFDRTAFTDVLTQADREKIRTKYFTTYKAKASGKSAAKENEIPRTVAAYLFFYDHLTKLLQSPVDYLGTEAYSSGEVLDALVYVFLNEFQSVVIILGKTDDAQVIFESLNARGAPLLASDLIRNYAFMRAEQNRENLDEIYTNEWSDFEDGFWEAEDRQGRLKKPRMEFFFANFLAAENGREINQSRIFQEYIDWIALRKRDLSVKEELRLIKRHAKVYKHLVAPIGDSDLQNFSRFLAAFDFRIAFPLVMAVFVDNEIFSEEKSEILATIESYIVRRAICERTTKGYNKVFLQAVREMRTKGISKRVLQDFFSNLSGDSVDWPNDNQFQAAFLRKPVYQMLKSQSLVYILSRLEYAERSKFSEVISIDSQMTVEHVMPQAWVGKWELENGRQVTQSQFDKAVRYERLGQPLDTLDMEIVRRNASINTFGNLTLVVGNLNSSLGAGSFEDKRRAILQHSALRLNRYFHSTDVWSVHEISKRAEVLFKDALSLWKGPSGQVFGLDRS